MTAEKKLRLGGMALANGLLVHGPTHWAAAVRTRDGQIKSASGRKPRFRATDNVPGLRGVARLGEAMLVIPLVKKGLPEVRLPFQHPSVAAVTALTTLAAAAIKRSTRPAIGDAGAALISIAPALFTLRAGEVAQYHGVEHKAIKAYEQGNDDASQADKEHERCGSHLVAPMLASNVAGTVLLRHVLTRPNPYANAAISLASTAIAVEAFAYAERHDGSVFSRAFRSPGFAIQRAIGTREPDAAQLEVGRAALDEILRAEGAMGS
ncbi:MAG: hypothetical protein QOF76_4951 [Solirubrobacteraceae bacterium]|nr:hypothetical protein [Solirubrobacteraceae bacterium]